MSKHQRAKLYMVYLHPWTLAEQIGTADVPFIGSIILPSANSVGTVRGVWKKYIQQVYPHAMRTIRNFMANSWAESHKDEDEDDMLHGPAMSYAMTFDDVNRVLSAERRTMQRQTEGATATVKAVERSTDVAMTLCRLQSFGGDFTQQRLESILQRQDRLTFSDTKATSAEVEAAPDGTAIFHTQRHDWPSIQLAYRQWVHDVYGEDSTKVPTTQQTQILDLVHRRRKFEFFVEQSIPVDEDIKDMSPVPLYRLIHGLPGAGKTQVLIWLRDYFEKVWKWVHGDQFVFVACMNSMADNIGGYTLHSFFSMPFKDRRGMTINSSAADENWSSLLTKMSLLEFIFVDEVEAAGAELLGRMEEEARRCTRRASMYRFPIVNETGLGNLPRPFGGVNIFLIGDWWQLHPTGGIAIMSNPEARIVQECSQAQSIMASLWCSARELEDPTAVTFNLQKWTSGQQVLELSTNIRSGKDAWWNEVLEQCRQGALSQDNYDWIHGYDAQSSIADAPLKFWYDYRTAPEPPCTNLNCKDTCSPCKAEKARRNRQLPQVLPGDFKDAILVSPHNQAVFHYSLHCAREFALRHSRQLMWCPPRDTAPAFFVAGYTAEEMKRKQQNWLFYNARNTEGVLSLFPMCYDLPVRITRGNGKDMKEYGIHNGGRGRIRDWVLHPDDVARLQTNSDGEVTLTQLPLRIVLCMETPMRKKHPEYPDKHFPLLPVTTYWNLGGHFGSDAVEIRRRGYGMVPNFSTTIDGATGRTIDKSIAALGAWTEVASPTRAMKGYIALSRVRCAHDILLAEPFSPCLFTQGEQQWPSLLLQVQRGNVVVDENFPMRCEAVDKAAKKMKKLVAGSFFCATCKADFLLSHFVAPCDDSSEWYAHVKAYVLECGGRRRSCANRDVYTLQTKEKEEAILKCGSCHEIKPRGGFSESRFHHRHFQKLTCLVCDTQTLTCGRCHEIKPRASFSESRHLHRNVRALICLVCETEAQESKAEETFPCGLCEVVKPRTAYSDSVLHNRFDKKRKMLCRECARPKCTNARCPLCPTCRQQHRKTKAPCTQPLEALNPKQQPKRQEDLATWLCEVCRPRFCQNWPQCRKEHRGKKQHTNTLYTCGECQTLAFSQAEHLRHVAKK